MMKKLLLMFFAFLLLFGCTADKPLDKPTQQVSCCNRTVAEEEHRCVLIDPPADFNYNSGTGSCYMDRNVCNITVSDPVKGEFVMEVPICSGEKNQSCLDAECKAMVCGNFLYRPQPPPAMPTEEEMESGEAVPLTTSEEAGYLLYKADCKFFNMDENLSKLLERTGSMVNSFRFGIGNNSLFFADYEKYKYFFPPTDAFCSVNPTSKVDRYMNYFEMCAIPGACASLSSSPLNDPSAYFSKHECAPYTEGMTEQDKLELKERYPFFYTTIESQETLVPSGYRVDYNGAFDSVFYRRALAAQYFDLMYKENQTAPFECSSGECMSGNCNKQDYRRSFIVKNDNSKVPVECYYDYIRGRKVAVCTSVINRSFEMLSDGTMFANITYAPVEVYALEVSMRDDRYDSKELTQATGPNSVHALTMLTMGLATDQADYLFNSYSLNPINANFHINGWHTSYLSDMRQPQPVSITTIPAFFGSEIRIKSDQNTSCSSEFGPGWIDLGDGLRQLFDLDSEWCNLYGSDKPYCSEASELPEKYWCYHFQIEENTSAYPPAQTIYFFNRDQFRIINEETKTYDSYPILYEDVPENRQVIGYATGRPSSSPRESDIFQICNMKEGEDYIVRDLVYFLPWIASVSNPRLSLSLMNLEDNQEMALAELGKKGRASESQIALASIPWMLAYFKCNDDGSGSECNGTWLQKPEYMVLAKNNIFALQQNRSIKTLEAADFTNNSEYADRLYMDRDGYKKHYVLASRYLTLIFSLGDCKLDEGNKIPVLEEYGWCKPCTYATMAYGKAPVEPEEEEDGGLFGSLEQRIRLLILYEFQRYKTYSMLVNYLKNGIMPIVDFREANSHYLDDPNCHVSENGLTIACDEGGIIRTSTPYSYSIITEPWKEVNGVGPVIALIGYDRTQHGVNPARALEESRLVKSRCENCLVAVPFFASSNSYEGGEYIRMNYLSFDAYSTISNVWSAERDSGAAAFDAAVIEFPVADVMQDYASVDDWGYLTAKERADIVVDRMYMYAWSINHIAAGMGKKQPVPVVILLNLETDPAKGWPSFSGISEEEKQIIRRFYADFFSNIYLSRDKLRKAGIISIVYSPFSSEDESIVRQAGEFDSKFCSFQEGTYDFIGVSALSRNVALYLPEEGSKGGASEETKGESGSSSVSSPSFYQSDSISMYMPTTFQQAQYDFQVSPVGGGLSWYVPQGELTPGGNLYCEECAEAEYCPEEYMMCEDGTVCIPRAGTTGPYKCPRGVISRKCRLCSDTEGWITCLMRRYTEPTESQRSLPVDGNYPSYFKVIRYSELSDAEDDIIGMLPPADRCCLVDSSGALYTFKRIEMNAVNTVPAAFSGNFSMPPTNNLLHDCGFVDPTIVTSEGGIRICGITKTPDEPLECKKSGTWLTYDE